MKTAPKQNGPEATDSGLDLQNINTQLHYTNILFV